MELMDDIKELQDVKLDEAEALHKGDVEPEEVVPPHEADECTDLPPQEEIPKETLGRYQVVGHCKCCEAPIYVEEYRASKVTRPTLIYTCSEDYCWAGYDERDVKWTPKYVNGFDLPIVGEDNVVKS